MFRRSRLIIRGSLGSWAFRTDTVTSSSVITPQSLPYTLYTSGCTSPLLISANFMYFDDSVILGRLNDNKSGSHLTQWCTDNYLQLNVDNTKKETLGLRHQTHPTRLNLTSIHDSSAGLQLLMSRTHHWRSAQRRSTPPWHPYMLLAKTSCHQWTQSTELDAVAPPVALQKPNPTHPALLLFPLLLPQSIRAQSHRTPSTHNIKWHWSPPKPILHITSMWSERHHT